MEGFSYSLPADLEQAVEDARRSWEHSNCTERLWRRDASLWTNTGESKWLGWLEIVGSQLAGISKFKALAAEIQEDGFTHFLVLGMGGSSLCPETFSVTFKKQPHAPELLVLDSTIRSTFKAFARKSIRPAPCFAFRVSPAPLSNRTSSCNTSSRKRSRL